MLEVATLLTASFIESENRMKHPEHTTSVQVGPTLREISRWHEDLCELHGRLRPHFARPEVHQQALGYLQVVLRDVPRKNGWQLAEQARQAHPYGMQRLRSQAVWDQEAVRDEVRRLISETLRSPRPQEADEAPFPVLVLDESGFPKRGRHSAGVGPQYCGRTGRVENCQVGVFLSYVTAAGHALIDRELYLPEDWCADPARRQAAHIPEAVCFATKPELGHQMIERAQEAFLPIRWVVADTVYGHSPDLRASLEDQDLAYALSAPSIQAVCVQTRAGLLLLAVASHTQLTCALTATPPRRTRRRRLPAPRTSRSPSLKPVLCWPTSSGRRPLPPPGSASGRSLGAPISIGPAIISVAVPRKRGKSPGRAT